MGFPVRVASDGVVWAETAVSKQNREPAAMVSRDVFTLDLVEINWVRVLDALRRLRGVCCLFYIALLRGRLWLELRLFSRALPGVLAFLGKDSTVKRKFDIGTIILSLLIAGCFSRLAFAKDEPKWIEVHSAHFSVITDAGDKRGREVALRMEQMRAVFGQLILKDKLKMSVPITVVALKSDKQYGLVAPAKQSMAAGFYVPGADRVYIVLNLFEADPWRAVAHPLAHYFLNYNYPTAQGWFDEGLAEYFGSIYIGKQVEIGGDPELLPDWHEDIFDEMRRDASAPQSLTQLVSSPVWISIVDLFTMKHDGSGTREGTHNTLYYAQAWMVVHYLVNKNKMPEAGTYFDLVLNQKVPVDKAMVQAFDMTPAQM